MPANYAHLRFGQEMMPKLPPDVLRAVQKYPKLYKLGAHGPDFLFCYRPGLIPWDKSLGHRYHYGDTRAFFSGIVRRLRLKPREEATAYLYGLLTHYALDSQCHPYIKQADAEGIAGHIQIETEFDRLLLEKDGLLSPKPHFSLEHLKLNRQERSLLAFFYPKAPPAQIRGGITAMRWLFGCSMLREGRGAAAAKKLLGGTFSQYIMTPKPDARCAETNRRLLELTAQASRRFEPLCAGLTAHITRKTPLGEEFAPIFG